MQSLQFLDIDHIYGTFKIDDSISDFVTANTRLYRIHKHNGKHREIVVPNLKLKNIQRWILKNMLQHHEVANCAHGFVKNKSILTNACSHIHTEEYWLLRIDIQDFFPSIKFEEIKAIFERENPEEVSTILAKLCTKDDRLAQGFSTSPILSNIYMFNFDNTFSETLRSIDTNYNIVYTRYVDDIFISGLKKDDYMMVINRIEQEVTRLLNSLGFSINDSKTKIQLDRRKKITGLYIDNQNVSVSKNYIKKIESDIYYCKKYGVIEHLLFHNKLSVANFKGYMYGRVAFLKMANMVEGTRLMNELEEIDWPI